MMVEAVPLHNVEIAWAFYELADLLELKGENFFKIRAYRQAARTIAGLADSVEDLYRANSLARIPGIGKNITAKIGELVEKGRMDKLEQVREEVPGGLREVMALPGIGPKRAAFLHQSLGVASLEGLVRAAREKKVRKLPGMGVKTEQEIIRSVEMVRGRQGRILLSAARDLAGILEEYLRDLPAVVRVSVAGSLRRWKETVGDIDMVVATRDPLAVLDAVAAYPRAAGILERDGNHIKINTWWGVPVEVITVDPESFWPVLLQCTGSREHLAALADHAGNKGSLQSGGSIGSEEDIYACLGLQYVPPELREGGEKVKAAAEGKLPRLVRVEDIRGDLHVHSHWSDGISTVEELAARAVEKGYGYIAITDHSQSLKIAGGLSRERLERQHEDIDRLNSESSGFRILKGTEVDILARGGLDFPDETLEDTEVVVASVHSGFRQDRQTITARLLEAARSRHVNILGHLTGRLLGQREAYDLDVERVLEEAGKHGKILEINSSPDRLDLNERHARMAVDFGARIAINTDAHDARRMDEIVYGVSVARRAGLEPEDIVNTMELPDLLQVLKREKG